MWILRTFALRLALPFYTASFRSPTYAEGSPSEPQAADAFRFTTTSLQLDL
jgi:hypothetical protein